MLLGGIICEYNPFHLGHAVHIEKTREALGGEAGIVCVMSGNYVQRGEPAIVSKHARAEMAVKCGADLVLELPTPWATATAERFALGGVSVLHALGVPVTLSFGSECGDADRLSRVAETLTSDRAFRLIREKLRDGISYAAARQQAAEELLPEDAELLREPNNILGVEYLKAIRTLGADITPMTFTRIATEHDGEAAEGLAPASALREMLLRGEAVEEYVPREAWKVLVREFSEGRAPVDIRESESSVLYRLRTMPEAYFERLPYGGEGLWSRLMEAGRTAAGYDEVLAGTKSKRYAMSRIRRMVLAAYLGISEDMSEGVPPYIRILGFNRRGRRILHEVKNTVRLPVITKPAAARELGGRAGEIFSAEVTATDIYSLMYPLRDNRAGGREWTTGPVFIDE